MALPTKLADVPAKYPPEALVAGVQGVVIAEIVVNESGNVTDTKLLRSIPLPMRRRLRQSANGDFHRQS